MRRLARWSLVHPATTLALLAALSAVFAAGLPRLSTDVGYRAFLGADHPSVARFDRFLDRFGGGLPMAAVWRCTDATACSRATDAESLSMASRVADRLRGAPGVGVVRSPANAPIAVPTPYGPALRHLWENGGPALDHLALGERARIDPGWRGRLVSEDGSTGAIVVELTSSTSDDARRAYAALDDALAPEERNGFVFHRVGGPVEFVVAGNELESATARLIPVMVGLVGLTLVLLFRSLATAASVLASVGLSVVWTMGLLGWMSQLGWAQNSLTQVLPPLVLVIGVCDGIHLVASAAAAALARPFDEWPDRVARIAASADEVVWPCTLTTLTTAAGFLAFLSADLDSFARFGVLAAIGVGFALVHCFTLLPILLAWLPPSSLRARRFSELWEDELARLVGWSAEHARSVLAVAVAVGLAGVWGMTRLDVDASFEELYGRDSRVVRWANFVSKHLRQPDTLEIDLRLPETTAISDPEALRAIEVTSRAIERVDTLGPAESIVDVVAWTHRLVRGDDPAYQTIADEAHENAALLNATRLLSGRSMDDALSPWLDVSERHVRISVESGKTPQEPLRQAMARVEGILAADLPPGWSGEATGPLALVHDLIEAVRTTQLRSFAAALAMVWLLVMIFLRSIRWALLSLVPTVLPVIVTLGSMAMLGLALDVGSAMVAAVVLGLAVDDTIHLLESFRRRRHAGAAADVAMRDAARHVGRALVTTSLALSLGFSALALSPWKSVSSFGLISAVTIAGALLTCLVVLPALVTVLVAQQPDGDAPEREPST